MFMMMMMMFMMILKGEAGLIKKKASL